MALPDVDEFDSPQQIDDYGEPLEEEPVFDPGIEEIEEVEVFVPVKRKLVLDPARRRIFEALKIPLEVEELVPKVVRMKIKHFQESPRELVNLRTKGEGITTPTPRATKLRRYGEDSPIRKIFKAHTPAEPKVPINPKFDRYPIRFGDKVRFNVPEVPKTLEGIVMNFVKKSKQARVLTLDDEILEVPRSAIPAGTRVRDLVEIEFDKKIPAETLTGQFATYLDKKDKPAKKGPRARILEGELRYIHDVSSKLLPEGAKPGDEVTVTLKKERTAHKKMNVRLLRSQEDGIVIAGDDGKTYIAAYESVWKVVHVRKPPTPKKAETGVWDIMAQEEVPPRIREIIINQYYEAFQTLVALKLEPEEKIKEIPRKLTFTTKITWAQYYSQQFAEWRLKEHLSSIRTRIMEADIAAEAEAIFQARQDPQVLIQELGQQYPNLFEGSAKEIISKISSIQKPPALAVAIMVGLERTGRDLTGRDLIVEIVNIVHGYILAHPLDLKIIKSRIYDAKVMEEFARIPVSKKERREYDRKYLSEIQKLYEDYSNAYDTEFKALEEVEAKKKAREKERKTKKEGKERLEKEKEKLRKEFEERKKHVKTELELEEIEREERVFLFSPKRPRELTPAEEHLWSQIREFEKTIYYGEGSNVFRYLNFVLFPYIFLVGDIGKRAEFFNDKIRTGHFRINKLYKARLPHTFPEFFMNQGLPDEDFDRIMRYIQATLLHNMTSIVHVYLSSLPENIGKKIGGEPQRPEPISWEGIIPVPTQEEEILDKLKSLVPEITEYVPKIMELEKKKPHAPKVSDAKVRKLLSKKSIERKVIKDILAYRSGEKKIVSAKRERTNPLVVKPQDVCSEQTKSGYEERIIGREKLEELVPGIYLEIPDILKRKLRPEFKPIKPRASPFEVSDIKVRKILLKKGVLRKVIKQVLETRLDIVAQKPARVPIPNSDLVICLDEGKFSCHRISDIIGSAIYKTNNPYTGKPFPPKFVAKIVKRYPELVEELDIFGELEEPSVKPEKELSIKPKKKPSVKPKKKLISSSSRNQPFSEQSIGKLDWADISDLEDELSKLKKKRKKTKADKKRIKQIEKLLE